MGGRFSKQLTVRFVIVQLVFATLWLEMLGWEARPVLRYNFGTSRILASVSLLALGGSKILPPDGGEVFEAINC